MTMSPNASARKLASGNNLSPERAIWSSVMGRITGLATPILLNMTPRVISAKAPMPWTERMKRTRIRPKKRK